MSCVGRRGFSESVPCFAAIEMFPLARRAALRASAILSSAFCLGVKSLPSLRSCSRFAFSFSLRRIRSASFRSSSSRSLRSSSSIRRSRSSSLARSSSSAFFCAARRACKAAIAALGALRGAGAGSAAFFFFFFFFLSAAEVGASAPSPSSSSSCSSVAGIFDSSVAVASFVSSCSAGACFC